MKPIVLLIGQLPDIGQVTQQLHHLPIEWLGAHDHGEVIRQLDTEPRICCVVLGGSLDDHLRGDLVALVASRRPDLCIHVKDRASGPQGLAPFVQKIAEGLILHELERAA